jgi:DNA-binding ferritin-like protein (Dps family)
MKNKTNVKEVGVANLVNLEELAERTMEVYEGYRSNGYNFDIEHAALVTTHLALNNIDIEKLLLSIDTLYIASVDSDDEHEVISDDIATFCTENYSDNCTVNYISLKPFEVTIDDGIVKAKLVKISELVDRLSDEEFGDFTQSLRELVQRVLIKAIIQRLNK